MNKNLAPVAPPRSRARDLMEGLFARADIQIGGPRPFDVRVHNEAFFDRAIRYGDLGIGEAYMDGWWDCDAIDEMATRFIRADLHRASHRSPHFVLYYLRMLLSGVGRRGKAFEVGQHHYDMGNDLFTAMLDKRMAYSCAYWKDAATLDQAQENKLDLVCRKIGLQPGMRVLDIGCGWGSFARFAAERYGAQVVGLTVSVEQQKFAQASCAGLPVEIRLQDYREINQRFDRVVSIAMIEAVGQHYYKTFMKVAERCLKDDGLFLLHSIVAQTHQGQAQARWLNEYIFPNGELPSLAQLLKAAEGLFVVEGVHRLEGDYDRTLGAWQQNFNAHWPALRDQYGERFYRMWIFYLSISRGIFRSRLASVWHIVFSKNGIAALPSGHVEGVRAFVDAR